MAKRKLKAAPASLLIQQRTSELLEAGLKAIDKLNALLEKQRLTIETLGCPALKDIGSYIQIQEDSINSREFKAKDAILMNAPCQMGPVNRVFEVENFDNEDPLRSVQNAT